MLNLISFSICGVLSFGVMLTNAHAAELESHSTASTVDAETITQLSNTPIQITDAEGGSGSGDHRGADRRN